MRVTEVTVSRSKKANLGNFESAELFVAVKAEVDSTESAKDVGDALARLTDTLVKEHAPKDFETRARERTKAGGVP